MRDFIVREIKLEQDVGGLLKLDTSSASDCVYEVDYPEEDVLRLRLVAAPERMNWRFPLTLDADPWKFGWIASRDDDILGFIATEYASWNRRMTIWHCYVDRAHRQHGIGRALMELAIAHGRKLGATTAWLETSNLNGTGIAAYRQMGFSICGFDLTLYRGTPSDGQFAIFLERAL